MGKDPRGFKEICGKNSCVCKGYPKANVRESLLKGPVTLQDCANACKQKYLCFGIEYWGQRKEGENCFLCPVDPSKRSTVNSVDVSKIHHNGKTTENQWATVYIKERNDVGRGPGKKLKDQTHQ